MSAPAATAAPQRTVFQPFPGFQEACLAASEDEVLIGGAKGPGKTLLLVAKPLYQVQYSAYKALFLRRTWGELQEALDRAHNLYGALPRHMRPGWNGEQSRFTFPSRAKVRFGHCERLEQVQTYHGGEWADVLYDEIGNQPDEAVWDRLLTEQRCPDPRVTRTAMGSANPGGAGHPWLVRRFVKPCGKYGERVAWAKVALADGTDEWRSRRFVPGNVRDNPIYANDRVYMANLLSQPDRLVRMLYYGDWDAATGLAFDELEPAVHLVKPYECPEHWSYVAGFDWGFNHNAVFMWGRVSEDGRIVICDVIKRRLLRDWDLAATYNALVPQPALTHVHSGHDCWNEIRARGENAPQTAEYFDRQGIHLVRANIDRAMGYQNLLQYLAWRETEFLPQRQPMLTFFDTPGCRWLVEEHLPAMVVDPDDPRDVLKTDTDDDGRGGDDGYDGLRHLTSSRPMKPASLLDQVPMSAWHPAVLRAEMERRRHRSPTLRTSRSPYMGV